MQPTDIFDYKRDREHIALEKSRMKCIDAYWMNTAPCTIHYIGSTYSGAGEGGADLAILYKGSIDRTASQAYASCVLPSLLFPRRIRSCNHSRPHIPCALRTYNKDGLYRSFGIPRLLFCMCIAGNVCHIRKIPESIKTKMAEKTGRTQRKRIFTGSHKILLRLCIRHASIWVACSSCRHFLQIFFPL